MTAVLFDGVVLGLQYGLLGVGLTLVYGLGGVLNLAHGQIAVVGAIVASLAIDAGIPVVPAAAIGILGAGMIGLFLDRTLMQSVYRREGEERVLLGLLLTLGVGFIIDGLLTWRFPIQQLGINIGGGAVEFAGITMRRGSLLASAIALVTGAILVLFFRWVPQGKAVRSVIQDEEGARLVGVNPAAVRTVIFGASASLAGLVAVTRSMTSPVPVTEGVAFTILALIVTVVGGLGNVSGAFLAGLLLGVVNAISSFYIGTFVTTIVLLVAAALTIVLRPAGLLGRS